MPDVSPSRQPLGPTGEQWATFGSRHRLAIGLTLLALAGTFLAVQLRSDGPAATGQEDLLSRDVGETEARSTPDGATPGGPDAGAATPGAERTVGPGGDYAELQAALDDARPGTTIRLIGPDSHRGPVVTSRAGTTEDPITIVAEPGVALTCETSVRCLQIAHSSYRVRNLTIVGGSSGIYMVGGGPGEYVSDVEIHDSTVVGHPEGGTGECIRVKYQAFDIEISGNELIDCGRGVCCEDSKNGEGVYVGTAPEQLGANPTDEPDRTHDVWIHHNTIHSLSECVEAKEHAHSILVEYNTCSGQIDEDGAALGSRGGEVGQGNVFRYNVVESAVGACVRLGGDREVDGLGNAVYGNVCRDVTGRVGVNQQRLPQGVICGNRFEGEQPSQLSNEAAVDPTTPCPESVTDSSG